jgi:hypothetical protein
MLRRALSSCWGRVRLRLGGATEKTSPGKSTLAGLYVGMRTRMLRRNAPPVGRGESGVM